MAGPLEKELIQNEISALIGARDLRKVRDSLVAFSPEEIADLIKDMPDEDKAIVFRILPRELGADVFEMLELDSQKGLLSALSAERIAVILNEMEPDDRTALLEEFPASATRELVNLLDKTERVLALKLLGYPEGSVGRLMTPDYVAVREDWTIQKVFDHIRTHARESDNVHLVYVLDEKGRFIFDIRIREILLSAPDATMASLKKQSFNALHWAQPQETTIEMFRKYDRTALPVVDTQGVMLGIVTIDDVLDVAEEEATEDIQKMGGQEALDEPYLKTPLRELIRKRAVWLVVLFVGEMLTASAMAVFEGKIQKAVVLALFVPLIISSGGNSGSQAATLIIRALAVGELTFKDWWQVMRREVLSGLCLGIILGLIGLVRVAAWTMFTDLYGPHWFLVGIVVASSLVTVVLWGTVAGSMLPLLLRRLGLDPATSSAPFVATLVDVVGIVTYFSIASALLSGILL